MFYREEESDATLVKAGDGWELGRGLGNTKGSVCFSPSYSAAHLTLKKSIRPPSG